jgi:hypothetical protein
MASANAGTTGGGEDTSDSTAQMDKYLEEQRKKRQDAANQLQEILNKRPLGNLKVDPFSDDFAPSKLDVNLQKLLSAEFGLKFDDGKGLGTKPKADATQWRLRTKAIRV